MCIYVCVNVCHVCGAIKLEEGSRSLRDEITFGCKLPDMGTRTELGYSVRAFYHFNC